METILQVVSEEPVPPARLQPKVPRDLQTICLKCLAKVPRKRYGSAEDLAEDLRRFQAGEPIEARPVTRLERTWKWARRRPALAALIVVIVLATVGLLGGGVWFTVQLDEARQKAEGLAANEKQLREDAQQKRKEAQNALEKERNLLREKDIYLAQLARIWYDRSDLEFQKGNILDSLNWTLQAYEATPERDPLRRVCLHRLALQESLLEERVLRHVGPVTAVAFSPDGRTLLTGSADKTAQLWEMATGKFLIRLDHDAAVLAAAFSPDSRTVLTGSADKTARLWEARTGKLLTRLDHDAAVVAAAFSPDGRTFLTGSGDQTVRLWNATNSNLVSRLANPDVLVSPLTKPAMNSRKAAMPFPSLLRRKT